MQSFAYVRATTIEGALSAAGPRVAFLAGGTSLVDLMKLGVMQPATIVDVSTVPEAEISALSDGGLRLGALTRNSAVARDPRVQEAFPLLAEAVLSGATPQLRNMATVGGNLLQRTRCPYFRDPHAACNKRVPRSGCSAIGGHHREMAVLGTSGSCIAIHPSDMCVALCALGATVVVRSPNGERRIPLGELYRLPGDTPQQETTLEPGELIAAVEIAHLPFARGSHYLKVRDRASYQFALASAAVALDLDDDVIRAARIALGGVATIPWRARRAERVLVGARAEASSFERAAEAELAAARPFAENAFKVLLAHRTLVLALTVVVERRAR